MLEINVHYLSVSFSKRGNDVLERENVTWLKTVLKMKEHSKYKLYPVGFPLWNVCLRTLIVMHHRTTAYDVMFLIYVKYEHFYSDVNWSTLKVCEKRHECHWKRKTFKNKDCLCEVNKTIVIYMYLLVIYMYVCVWLCYVYNKVRCN